MKTVLALAATLLCSNPRTVDGDTLACSTGERVRIWGVNSPESKDPGGREAAAYMRHLTHGKTLSCTVKGRDRYQRIVAQCFIEGRDVAGEMVRAGHARDWPKFSHGAYAKDQPK